MTQNFLYMFEFVVDDLLITHPNECAPDEYPTCCELTFRSSVFVSICDKDFGGCLESAAKTGKCCIFSLESAITKQDKLYVHVYKKKVERCKFLLGATEIPVHDLFENVTCKFIEENPNYIPEEATRLTIDKACDNPCVEKKARQEEFCPGYEMTKKLHALFDLCGKQTGNIVLINRLSCMGPTIVSPFLIPKVCDSICPLPGIPPCPKEEPVTIACQRFFATNKEKCCPCEKCQDECDRQANRLGGGRENCSDSSCPSTKSSRLGPSCPRPLCACPECQTTCEEEKTDVEKNKCTSTKENEREQQDTTTTSPGSEDSYEPCTVCPTKPEPNQDAFDEFEAILNGSGMVIRLMRGCYVVKDVADSDYNSDEDCCPNIPSTESSDCNLSPKGNVVQNHIKRRTGGYITNDITIPRVRGNIKYSGNDCCCVENFTPHSAGPYCIESANNKAEKYRLRPPGSRNRCFQVNPDEVDQAIPPTTYDTIPKNGIEVCKRVCKDEDADVFVLKLGKKQKYRNKQRMIEIELKTPKEPVIIKRQKITVGTQIDEVTLNNELYCACAKKGKGKKKRKGKKASK